MAGSHYKLDKHLFNRIIIIIAVAFFPTGQQ